MLARFCRRRPLVVAAWLMSAALLTMVAACQSPSPPVQTQSSGVTAAPAAPAPEREIFVYDGDARGVPPADILNADADVALLVPPAEPGALSQLPPSDLGAVRVALLLPLSGRLSQLGQAMLNAAQMAVFNVAPPGFELHPYDTRGTPEDASAAARTAIEDGAALIIGPLLSSSTAAVAEVAQLSSTPVISFSNDRTVAGDNVYILGLTPGEQVKRVIAYAASQGYRRIAVVAPDNGYGEVVVSAARDSAYDLGIDVTHIELHDPGAQDFTELVQRLAAVQKGGGVSAAASNEAVPPGADGARRWTRGGGFDALLVADGGQQLQTIAALLPYYGIEPAEVKVLGTGVWDEPNTGREPALVGGWYAVPPPDNRNRFLEQYRATYGETPPRLATLAYDATALAAVLARNRGSDAFEPRVLMAPNGFAGSEGIFRFIPGGTAERGLAVMEVQPRGSQVVSYAPTGF